MRQGTDLDAALEPLLFEFCQVPSNPAKFVVFDRDGTLTQDDGYTYRTQDLAWMPGALDLLANLGEAGVPTFIATNQSGIARGYYSIEQMNEFHSLLVSEARAHGGNICAIAVCPHLAAGTVAEYTGACACRKPEAGLLVCLAERYGLTWAHGLVVGDKSSDREAARRVGAATVDATRPDWVDATIGWVAQP